MSSPGALRIAAFLLLALAGCGSDAPVSRYELRGKVVGVDADAGTVTVAHEPVEGFMDAMTMPFPLKDAWAFQALAPGDELNAILVVRGREYWLEELVITRGPPASGAELSRGEPPLGARVPDVELVNQHGERIRLRDYEGKAIALTFIYTRCPLADFCPRMTRHFGVLENELRGEPELYARTHLFTISFDPEHDTPEKLEAYAWQQALVRGETFDHWEFATAAAEPLAELASFFGLEYRSEDGQIVHNLKTAVVAPDGTLAALYGGNDWRPEDVLAALREAAFMSSR